MFGAGLLSIGKSRLDADALARRRTLTSLREDQACFGPNQIFVKREVNEHRIAASARRCRPTGSRFRLLGSASLGWWRATPVLQIVSRMTSACRLRAVGSIAGDLGIGGETKHETGQATQIVGPDGRPLQHSGDADRDDGWIYQATGAARGAVSSVREAGTAVLDHARRYTTGGARDKAERGTGQLAERLERDPWLIGVVGIVSGALLAALVAPTRIEQEYVDEARDRLWTKANELGHQAAERVRELADTTIQASEP
jgi:hypothetical protein